METETQKEVANSNPNPEKIIKTTKTVVSSNSEEEQPEHFEKKKVIFRTYQIVWYVLGIMEFLLGFRVLLKALSANPISGFTNLIYTLSDPLANPFSGILRVTVVGASVFEWSTLIAMAVYALFAYGIVKLIEFVKPVSPDEVKQKLDYQT
ncbi:MAG TPA: YggT family protein [Candidatus Sulfotelmatobacter sp.]|nr:YggT family protein [Candidatus Sulfotelmatobacter sp.]